MKSVYMAITPDEYELPLFVTDSAVEMAAWAGISRSSLLSMLTPFQQQRKKGWYKKAKRQIIRVQIEEDEDDGEV
jgi:hypothetical protein